MAGQSMPVPEWASDALRRSWTTLSRNDQQALINDRDNAVLRETAIRLRHTDSADSLGAAPTGDFTLDGRHHAGLRWHAERFERPWNGWVTPVVTRRTLENLIKDLAADDHTVGRIDNAGALTVYAEDPEENYVVRPDGDGLYHLVDLGWCFISLR